jgi:hypothetical protein
MAQPEYVSLEVLHSYSYRLADEAPERHDRK